MDELWAHLADGVVARTAGPLHLRLVLQPTVAVVLAVMAGWRDARQGRVPYFWGLLTDPVHRREMLRSGWKSVGKVFVLAWVLDLVYQLIATGTVFPGGALLVAVVLAIVPYLLVRGLVTRLARGRTGT